MLLLLLLLLLNSESKMYLDFLTLGDYKQPLWYKPWGPFLESPGNLTGPESYF